MTTASMGATQFPVILTYHSISEGGPPLQISPSLFAEQMAWLHANVRVAPLGEVVSALTERKPLPERTVVLTFDDGYSDFYFSAAPVLRRLKFPATIFVPTGLCGGADRPRPSAWVSPQPLLDWNQVAALAKEGFSFGAHSVSHPALPALSAEEAKHEIAGSKTELEEHTGQEVEFFAYPYGRWTPAVRTVVQQEYRGACSTGAGVVELDADPFALPRVDVHYLRRPAAFRMLFTAPFLAYVATRRFIRRIRHQPEGFYARV
jgi:peptidoglycan/xylan/chitin deacetylase (PgdA/CDA1 family)